MTAASPTGNMAPHRTALITGASSGLGRALALWLARRGVHVWAAARRAELLAEVAAEAPGAIEPLVLDVTDTERTLATLRDLDKSSGGLDLVVANAGLSGTTDGRSLRWEKIARIIDTNIRGAAATLTGALPGMVERGRGQLVGISSVAGFRGLPKRAAYSGSKAFLSTFLEGLRVDLVGTGVGVTCIQPGWIDTPLTRGNTFRMPFIVPVEYAAEICGRAIERRARVVTFPWQMALLVKLLRLMPSSWFDAVVGRASRR